VATVRSCSEIQPLPEKAENSEIRKLKFR